MKPKLKTFFVLIVAAGSVSFTVPTCSNGRSTAVLDLETFVYPQMCARLKKACEKKEKADKADKREFKKIIQNYLCHTLGDSRRSVCYDVAKRVFEKYPETFGEIVGGEVFGTGYAAFGLSIYNGTLFLEGKDESLAACKSTKRRSTTNLDARNKKKRKHPQRTVTAVFQLNLSLDFPKEIPWWSKRRNELSWLKCTAKQTAMMRRFSI